ncbi:MAG: ACT domain-containing protein [Treponema sp.]|nr:ACT domain-containing protein [Treponema sp.]MBR5966292.1 ACT domain-containing protein [Treponema sp.]
MNAIITVVGSDKVGIVAKVTSFLAEHSANIIDITQSILSGNFVMMLMVNLDKADLTIDSFRDKMLELGKSIGVEINVMNEAVFSAMHRV